MTSTHPLIDTHLLHRLQFAHSPLFLEHLPTPADLSSFLYTLHAHTARPLADRFSISLRDGSISISHQPLPTPGEPPAPTVHLVTTTTDYTWRSKTTYSSSWSSPVRIYHQHLIPTVLPLFDPLQQHLLQSTDPYLHQLYYFEGGPDSAPLYIVETAARYRSEKEPRIGKLDISTWPDQQNHSRRRATPAEITLWAISMLVPTSEEHDQARLQIIRTSIQALSPPLHLSPMTSIQHDISGYNLHRLLRNRHSTYLDGRARFPVLLSVVEDNSLLRPSAKDAFLARDPNATRRQIAPHQSQRHARHQHMVPTDESNADVLAGVSVLAAVTTSAGLQALRGGGGGGGGESVMVWVLPSIFTAFALSFALWTRILTGGISLSGALRLRRRIEMPGLLSWAARQPSETGARVHAMLTDVSRGYFDGVGLSFLPGKFTGHVRFDGEPFWISELMAGGFDTGFAADGREMLVGRDGEILRMVEMDEQGRCRFEKVKEDVPVEQAFVRWTRGTWWSDVQVR